MDLHSIAIVVMGVSGSGKTTVGRLLAQRLGCDFFDGDDFHPAANVEKMRQGQALTDEDRAPWLDRLRQLLDQKVGAGESAVLACSALKEAYRKRLVPEDPGKADHVRFLYLRISAEEAHQRLIARKGHFMPATLVASQFEALEEPDDALCIDATLLADEVVREAADVFLS